MTGGLDVVDIRLMLPKALLGCTGYGTADFPAYAGNGNQYSVHK